MTDFAISEPGRFAALQRYALAVFAPSSVSAAHFVVQLMLLATLTPAEFGAFAFLMIVVQFGFGLSNALVSTPYTVEVSSHADPHSDKRTMFFTANALFAVIFGLCAYLVGCLIADGSWTLLFSIFAGLAMVRWFGRAHNYAMLRPASSGISDIVYAVSLVTIVAIPAWSGMLAIETVALAFVIATLLGCLCLGGDFLVRQLGSWASLLPYREIWRGQSRWTLLGVVTTESTANIHSYLVTLLAGPAAFAPMGAAALFVRPVLLSVSSLSQLEIPILSRALASGDTVKAAATSRRFLHALLAIWLATAALAYAVITFIPSVIIKPAYSLGEVEIAVLLFLVISLFQVWQGPNSALLQAARHFKQLSKVSVISCAFSIAGALIALALLPPVYSLLGIAIGQLVMAVLMARLTRHTFVEGLKDANG
ncbi:MAG: polysaccharide biosynthesis protein [Rhizobium sp.]|nr:polysaccharide biosynthesis protein [Rhizobium sp.]